MKIKDSDSGVVISESENEQRRVERSISEVVRKEASFIQNPHIPADLSCDIIETDSSELVKTLKSKGHESKVRMTSFHKADMRVFKTSRSQKNQDSEVFKTKENQRDKGNQDKRRRIFLNHRSVTRLKDFKYKRISKTKSRSLEALRGKLR